VKEGGLISKHKPVVIYQNQAESSNNYIKKFGNCHAHCHKKLLAFL